MSHGPDARWAMGNRLWDRDRSCWRRRSSIQVCHRTKPRVGDDRPSGSPVVALLGRRPQRPYCGLDHAPESVPEEDVGEQTSPATSTALATAERRRVGSRPHQSDYGSLQRTGYHGRRDRRGRPSCVFARKSS